MDLLKIETRLKELATQLEGSAAKHNALVGAANELRKLYDEAKGIAPVVEEVIHDVIDAAEVIG